MFRRIFLPSATISGTTAKSPRYEDDVGDAAGHLASRFPARRRAGRPSARARRSPRRRPSRRSGPSRGAARRTRRLPSGEIRPITVASSASARRARPQLASRRRARRRRSPRRARSPRPCRGVAGDHPQLHALARKNSTVSARRWRSSSASTTSPSGSRPRGRRRTARANRAAPPRGPARPPAAPFGAASSSEREQLGCAEHASASRRDGPRSSAAPRRTARTPRVAAGLRRERRTRSRGASRSPRESSQRSAPSGSARSSSTPGSGQRRRAGAVRERARSCRDRGRRPTASDSIALSCCASAPRRASCSAAAANVSGRAGTSPSGMNVTKPATAVVTASRIGTSRCQSDATKIRPERHHRRHEHEQKPVHARSSGERGWRNSRASPAIRCAYDWHRRPRVTTNGPAPSTANEPERTSSPDRASTGRDSPVRIDSSSRARRLLEQPVGDDLVARLDAHEIAFDDVLDGNVPAAAVADDRRVRRDERRELGRACASRGAPARSRSRFAITIARNSASCQAPKTSVSAPNDDEDPVEDGEDVRADDAGRRAARRSGQDRASRLEPALRLGLGQARRGHTARVHAVDALAVAGRTSSRSAIAMSPRPGPQATVSRQPSRTRT